MSNLFQITEREGDTVNNDLSRLDQRSLEHRVGDLIRRYVRDRSAVLALSVVRHIEALIRHPDVRDPALLCAYRRLATHWRWLATEYSPLIFHDNRSLLS